MKCISILSTSI